MYGHDGECWSTPKWSSSNFPNFHEFWQSYCHKYPSPTRKQKPWENCGQNHIKSFITCLGGLQSLFKSSLGRWCYMFQ